MLLYSWVNENFPKIQVPQSHEQPFEYWNNQFHYGIHVRNLLLGLRSGPYVPWPPGFNSTISAFAGDESTPWERALELFTAMAVAEVQQDVAWPMGELWWFSMGFSSDIHGINHTVNGGFWWDLWGIHGDYRINDSYGIYVLMGFNNLTVDGLMGYGDFMRFSWDSHEIKYLWDKQMFNEI